jgi:hypothetical protein
VKGLKREQKQQKKSEEQVKTAAQEGVAVMEATLQRRKRASVRQSLGDQ